MEAFIGAVDCASMGSLAFDSLATDNSALVAGRSRAERSSAASLGRKRDSPDEKRWVAGSIASVESAAHQSVGTPILVASLGLATRIVEGFAGLHLVPGKCPLEVSMQVVGKFWLVVRNRHGWQVFDIQQAVRPNS